jgi:arsenate reductase/ArsR family transcriptional regulator
MAKQRSHELRDILAVTKALSDESRLRALMAVKDGELCLCQIIPVLGLSPATVSKHMDTLERAGLVQRRREGKWRYYRLAAGPNNTAASSALAWILNELRGDPQIRNDAVKIRSVRRQDLVELSACYRS